MTVGPALSENQVSQQLSQIALNMRDAARAAANFQEWAVSVGEAGLQGIGFDAADAQSVLSLSSYLNTAAAVFFGQAGQTPAFDFDNAVCQLYGGQ